MIKNKLKAFATHLAISIALVSLVVSAILYFWYPTQYLGVTNFKEIAILIVSIDLVMGPILTFVVFNPNKKSLRFDLAVIAIFQVSALAYGIHALYQTHPLFITYKQDSFALINASDISPEDAKYDEFKVSKLSSPKLAFAKMPEDPDEKMGIMVGVTIDGDPDIDKRAEYYEPFSKHLDEVFAKSIDPELIFADDKINTATQSFLEKHDDINNYSFHPLTGLGKSAILVLEKKSGDAVATIDANPWKY